MPLVCVGSLVGRMVVVELVIVAAVRRREVCIDILDVVGSAIPIETIMGLSGRAEVDGVAMAIGEVAEVCEVDAIAEKLSRVM